MDKQSHDAPAKVSPANTGFHQTSQKKDKTGAARAKAYRQRKKKQQCKSAANPAAAELLPEGIVTHYSRSIDCGTESSKLPRPTALNERSERGSTANTEVNRGGLLPAAPSRHFLATALLATAALTLSVVGILVNGSFARSLGSSDLAGWLFLAVGLAADLATLALPCVAARQWHIGQRATAVVGWIVWFVTFLFAVTASIGFASSNIADVTLVRASRVTPAVTSAQAMLKDAMTARDRECKGGVGKFCREREALVAQRHQVLDAAMTSVGRGADPQTEAAIKLLAWISGGIVRPTQEDFSMFRLILFALLPQIGGFLLLVGRHARDIGTDRTYH